MPAEAHALVSPPRPLQWAFTPTKPIVTLEFTAGTGARIPLQQSNITVNNTPVSKETHAITTWVQANLNVWVDARDPQLPTVNADLTATTPEGNLQQGPSGFTYPNSNPLHSPQRAHFTFLQPASGTVKATLTHADLWDAANTPYFTVIATVGHADGTHSHFQQHVLLDNEPPRGKIEYAMSIRTGIASYYITSDDLDTIELHFPDGSIIERQMPFYPRRGIIVVHKEGAPLAAHAVDRAGNRSGNLLTRVFDSPLLSSKRSPLAAWPLPKTYLDPKQFVLGSILQGFEEALALPADYAGDFLNFQKVSGERLNRFLDFFGLTREPGVTDSEMRERLILIVARNKQSPYGMGRALSRVTRQTVHIRDRGTHPPVQLQATFNGNHKFNGALTFAPHSHPIRRYGAFAVAFEDEPNIGWIRAKALISSLKSAGSVFRMELRLPTLQAEVLTTPSVKAQQEIRIASGPLLNALMTGTVTHHQLTFNGFAQFDGSHKFNGKSNTQQTSPL